MTLPWTTMDAAVILPFNSRLLSDCNVGLSSYFPLDIALDRRRSIKKEFPVDFSAGPKIGLV